MEVDVVYILGQTKGQMVTPLLLHFFGGEEFLGFISNEML